MAKMGRPEIELEWKVLDALLQRSTTKRDAASIMAISEDTIERHVQQKHGMTFKEYRESKMAPTRTKLVETALSKAFKGDNVMLIFCLKNLCNWKNEPDEDLEKLKLELAELMKQLAEMQKKAA